jgi:hypothetical protein
MRDLYTLRNKNACKMFLANKIIFLQADSNTEPLNQNANEQQITKK